MSSAKEWHGHWWLPDTAQIRVPGRLIVERDGASRLELIGGLDLRAYAPQGRTEKIFGLAEGRPLTLLDCFPLTHRGGSLLLPEHFHRLHVHQVLAGAHIDTSDSLFSSARVQIEHLTTWLSFPNSERSSDPQHLNYSASAKAVEPFTVSVNGWTITARSHAQPFQTTHLRQRDILSSDITTYLYFEPETPVPADGFDEIVFGMMDLITLASGEPSGLISATLFHTEGHAYPHNDGSTFTLPIEVESYGQRIHTAAPDEPSVSYGQFRFTCDDAPFAELVREWIRVRNAAATACNVYFGLSYNRPGFTETRLLALATVAESLHSSLYGDTTAMPREHFESLRATVLDAVSDMDDKKWLKEKLRNAPSYRERLRELAQIPDEIARADVVEDAEVWASRLVAARNGLAHTGNENGDADIFRLQGATSGLIALVFMAEIGLPSAIQQRAARRVLRLPDS